MYSRTLICTQFYHTGEVLLLKQNWVKTERKFRNQLTVIVYECRDILSCCGNSLGCTPGCSDAKGNDITKIRNDDGAIVMNLFLQPCVTRKRLRTHVLNSDVQLGSLAQYIHGTLVAQG